MSYLVDTSVLLDRLDYVKDLDEVIIVPEVLKELDRLKGLHREKGFLAREAVRYIKDELLDKIEIKNKPELKSTADERFIELAQENSPHTVLTSDMTLYLILHSLGADVELLEINREVPTQTFDVYLTDKEFEKLLKNKELKYHANDEFNNAHHYGIAYKASNQQGSILVHYYKDTLEVIHSQMPHIDDLKEIQPLNKEQIYLLDALYYRDIPLVMVTGCAGSGKTLLSLYLGIIATIHQKYRKILALQPPIHVGGVDRIGFLKGSKQDKLENYFSGIQNNLEFIAKGDEQILKEYIDFESVTLTRGSSYMDSFVILEEAQNSSALEMLTLVTRIGQGSKLIVLGDLDQIDTGLPWDKTGLGVLLQGMSDSKYATRIHLEKSLRSNLAKEAVQKVTPFLRK